MLFLCFFYAFPKQLSCFSYARAWKRLESSTDMHAIRRFIHLVRTLLRCCVRFRCPLPRFRGFFLILFEPAVARRTSGNWRHASRCARSASVSLRSRSAIAAIFQSRGHIDIRGHLEIPRGPDCLTEGRQRFEEEVDAGDGGKRGDIRRKQGGFLGSNGRQDDGEDEGSETGTLGRRVREL